jgi:predicted nucleotidyltransferase
MRLKPKQGQKKDDSLSPIVGASDLEPNGEGPRECQVRMMIIDVLEANADRLRGRKVVLFGSRARGTARPRSDFDVGILGEIPLPLNDFYAIEDMLDELPTLYRIELVDFARVSERFRRRALEQVEVLYD